MFTRRTFTYFVKVASTYNRNFRSKECLFRVFCRLAVKEFRFFRNEVGYLSIFARGEEVLYGFVCVFANLNCFFRDSLGGFWNFFGKEDRFS